MKKIISFIAIGLFVASCADKDLAINNEPSAQTTDITEQKASCENALSVKLKPEIAASISNDDNNLAFPTGNDALDRYLSAVKATKMRRVFPYAGKHEQQQREHGLNLWYTVTVDTTQTIATRAIKDVDSREVASIVEPVRKPRLEPYEVREVNLNSLKTRAWTEPFDDPYAAYQWNMKNNARFGNYVNSAGDSVISCVKGADINAVEAWKINSGSGNVVISVVDGGVDLTHEDLIDNIWVNEGEIPGNGIDDDNNGYIDDVNGFNFVTETGTIVPHSHGTHVAGVIAARNNNGKGICGIAGGDGSEGSGAKIMSCQIFQDNPDYDPYDINSPQTLTPKDYNTMAAAIVYGANNGALISQNSWGFSDYEPEPQLIREAIEYFIATAGSYKGSPMKGGLVVFAAGNDAKNTVQYPAADEDVIAVTAMAPDFLPAWYTNHGYKANICAPGGTEPRGEKYPYVSGKMALGLLSTLPQKDGISRYGYMQGTSMATPHIAGIAALVISQYGNSTFTADELRQRVLTGVKPIDINDYCSDEYRDRMGVGFADATVALTDFSMDVMPANPRFVTSETSVSYKEITVAFTSDAQEEGSLFNYILYVSESPITESNCNNDDVTRINVPANTDIHDVIKRRTMENLTPGTRYYFAIRVVARNGKQSKLVTYDGGIQTIPNKAPEVTSESDLTSTFIVAGNDEISLHLNVNDPENHTWTYEISHPNSTSITTTNDAIDLTIYAGKLAIGDTKITITITDQYGAQTVITLIIRKVQDNAPALTDASRYIDVQKGTTESVVLSDLFTDEEPETITFEVKSLANSNISASLSEGNLSVNGLLLGESGITISATDCHKQTATVTIPVFVYMNKGIYSLFPTTPTDVLYVKLAPQISGSVDLKIINAAGKTVLKKSVDTATLDAKKRTIAITISSLYPGKYELQMKANGKTYNETFVKQ